MSPAKHCAVCGDQSMSTYCSDECADEDYRRNQGAYHPEEDDNFGASSRWDA